MSQILEAIRLNYGCGEVRRAGYVGIDARPSGAAEYVLPAWDTSPWDPGSVDEIYSRHMFEHLDPPDARRTLEAWRDALRPGGLLHLIVPDLLFHARQLLGEVTSWSDEPARNFQHAICSIYGWRLPICGGNGEDAHRWGYTWDSLRGLLAEVGFTRIRRVVPASQAPQQDREALARAVEDTQPWHLNVLAEKPQVH